MNDAPKAAGTAWSDAALKVLRSAVSHSWYVDEDNILDVADLVRAGLIRVEQDFDHLAVRRTEAGTLLALDLGLVVASPNGAFRWGDRRLPDDA